MVDMTLSHKHGFYELSAQSEKGRDLVEKIRLSNRGDIGTDFSGQCILLDGFFASAVDWCSHHVVAAGMVLQWGDDLYSGEEGIAALDFG